METNVNPNQSSVTRHLLALAFAFALGLCAPAARGGEVVVNFNDLTYSSPYDPNQNYPKGQAPGTGSYDDGWDLKGGFTSHGTFFTNSYDSTYASWSGWAYSNVNDPTTTGSSPDTTDYLHQFAAVTGTAPGGSGNYGLEAGTGGAINLPGGTTPLSFQVTNTTYDYLSMKYGDGFAKQFTTGDYFELKIYGFTGLNGTGTKVGEVDFYLANFTGGNSLLVDTWTTVNLSSLAGAQSLTFDYASSDVGTFGINTPESFAMDNLTLGTTSVPEPSGLVLGLLASTIVAAAGRFRQR